MLRSRDRKPPRSFFGDAGGLVAGFGLFLFLGRLFRPIVGRREVHERFLYYGLCTAILSLLIHSLVDFNLHIPGNAAWFVVIMALALAHGTVLQRESQRSGR